MSKSLIQTVNQSNQTVSADSIISLGSTQRRYGCNLKLSGNGIEVSGEGYFKVNCGVSVTPTSVGPVTVALYDNGVQIPGAIAYGSVSTDVDVITLPLVATLRRGCGCESVDNLTVVLVTGAGTVNNISVQVEKS